MTAKHKVRVVADLDTYLSASTPAMLTGRTFSFVSVGNLRGFQMWGQPTQDDLRRTLDLVAAITHRLPLEQRYYLVVDLNAVSAEAGIDSTREVLEHWAKKRTSLATRVVRQAVVRPPGPMGALLPAFARLLRPRHPLEVFDSLHEAARWLDYSDGKALELFVGALRAQPAVDLAQRLRPWIAANLRTPSPTVAARALGVSVRTLQRRLNEGETTFHQLVREARIERAKELLQQQHLKVGFVAHEVGFRSSQDLATTFKRVTGLTPTEFRAQR